MNLDKLSRRKIHQFTIGITTLLYTFASLTLILAAFSLAGKAFYEIYDAVILKGEINKDILNAITYTVIAIAVCDVGRYLVEEEVEHEKNLHSPTDARKTITRFLVVISIALSLEGLIGVFEAGNSNISGVLYPIAIVICAVFVLLAMGIFQRLSVETEIRLQNEKDSKSDNDLC